ncbi:monodehydroascorbate reductase [Scenedesmus sp. NREL 46B-D3]|nr:monodehydroascorbate reductase [Scenedesmus sp. NREL 46B-D3]
MQGIVDKHVIASNQRPRQKESSLTRVGFGLRVTGGGIRASSLSKAYLFPQGAARLPGFHTCAGGGGERQGPDWYKEKGIAYLTNSRVAAADLAARSLTLASGDMITYQQLVVATGADPVRMTDFKAPGADLSGIHYLRNVADADALLVAVEAAKAAGNKAVVVGGGYIGLEVAAGLSMHGLDVTMVFPDDHLMARIFNAELAAFYEAYYAAKGIRLLKGQLAKEFRGDGKVSSVVLSDGSTLPADLVLVGAGARPVSGLFAGQLQLDKAGGIVVDGNFKTSVDGVYAIGDVAAFPLLAAGGELVRQEHVTHARSSAAHAAKALMGTNPTAYDYQPYFYSREFNLSWQLFGQTEGAEQVVTWGTLDVAAAAASAAPGGPAPKFGAYWIKGGRVVGAFIEGGAAEEAAALKALTTAAPAAPADVAELRAQGVAWALSKL